MKTKYKKYTNIYMDYLEQNHRRYSNTDTLRLCKLKDFLNFGYWHYVLKAIK